MTKLHNLLCYLNLISLWTSSNDYFRAFSNTFTNHIVGIYRFMSLLKSVINCFIWNFRTFIKIFDSLETEEHGMFPGNFSNIHSIGEWNEKRVEPKIIKTVRFYRNKKNTACRRINCEFLNSRPLLSLILIWLTAGAWIWSGLAVFIRIEFLAHSSSKSFIAPTNTEYIQSCRSLS